MARLSRRPVLSARNSGGQEDKEEYQDEYRQRRLLLQNRQLAMRNENLMQRITRLENQLTTIQRQLLVSRQNEATLKGRLRRSVSMVRDTIVAKFEELMAQYNDHLREFGDESSYVPLLLRSSSEQTSEDKPLGYLAGINEDLNRRKSQYFNETREKSPGSECDAIAEVSEEESGDEGVENKADSGALDGGTAATSVVVDEEEAKRDAIMNEEEVERDATSLTDDEKAEKITTSAMDREKAENISIPLVDQEEVKAADSVTEAKAATSVTEVNAATSVTEVNNATSFVEVKNNATPPIVPEYKEDEEDVPSKKQPRTLPPLGSTLRGLGIPSLACDDTLEPTVEPTKEPMQEGEKKTSRRLSGLERELKNLEFGVPVAWREEPNTEAYDTDPDEQAFSNQPMTENPFKESSPVKEVKKSKRRPSRLSRELKNLQFEMPLSWRDGEVKTDTSEEARNETKREMKDIEDDTPLIVPVLSRLSSTNSYLSNKKRKIAQFSRRRKKAQVLKDVSNVQKQTSEKTASIFDLPSGGESNKENDVPKTTKKGGRTTRKRKRNVVRV
ncbi:DEKNAAC103014 [Brettanomyces naardenensis]|uniref:DEKNAAC103014 n=1 Tax=Brettanomyces naardenensis TaxID=13370 RepID=A0A448YM77_BRENA|nr:DEKNAAC103014 [Brettanomyces naardenensis]